MPSLHERAKDLFLAALSHSPADRQARLAEACAGDEELRREVESLLAFHDEDQAEGGSAIAGSSVDRPKSETRPHTGPAAFGPGDVFAGRYRMVTRIGRGGMGDVWRADDLVLQTAVALKLLHSNDSA